jgi:hypothetical protein
MNKGINIKEIKRATKSFSSISEYKIMNKCPRQ